MNDCGDCMKVRPHRCPRHEQLEALSDMDRQINEEIVARARAAFEEAHAPTHEALEPVSPRERRWLRPRPPRDLDIQKHVTHPGPLAACTRPACRR